MISIIIPVYNGESTIKRCVDSCLNQTISDIEVIVVNDESIDNTLTILSKYDDKRLKVYSKRSNHAGAVSAYKYGIEHASGDYIYMIDSDDYIKKDYLENMLNTMLKYSVDCVCSSYIYDDGICKTNINNFLPNGIYKNNDFNLICNKAFKNQFDILPLRWNKLYKKNIIDKILIKLNLELIQREDNIFCYLYWINSYNTYINNSIAGYINVKTSSSITTKKDIEFWYKLKNSTDYLLNISKDTIQCSRLMLDNVVNYISKCINDKIKYKEIKPYLRHAFNDKLVIMACKEKKLYNLVEKTLISLIKYKKYFIVYFGIKIIKKIK